MRVLLDDLFEELTLAVGGMAALYDVDDTIVNRMCSSLRVVHQKGRARLRGEPQQDLLKDPKWQDELHPAVRSLLVDMGRG